MTTLHHEIDQLLRTTRQRYTDGRRELVELLAAIGRPATLPELVDRGAGQSQSSLYRNLGVLEQCGVVRRLVSVDDVSRFELAERLTEHHHHLVCRHCGRIEDVMLPAALEEALHAACDGVDHDGFEVDTHRVELLGTCGDCR